MFKRIGKENANKGATLVIVIVCMLFVGIVAAAVLMMLTGNINTVKTNEGSSENFYSAEGVVDDVKLYFQKIANNTATEAYSQVLSDLATDPGLDKEQAYKDYYKAMLTTKLTNELDVTKSGIAKIAEEDRLSEIGVADGTYKAVELSFASSTIDSDMVLKGVKIKYTDNEDYTTTIDTDIQFSCSLPPMNRAASSKSFPFNVDKFVIISDGGIVSGSDNTDGTIKGSLYSGSDLSLTLNSGATGRATLDILSQYIISKGDLEVSNGNVNIYGLSKGNSKQFSDLVKSASSAELKNQDDACLWVNGINLKAQKPQLVIDQENAKVNVKDDLSLNASESVFKMNKGSYMGFSSDNNTSGNVEAHDNSSAIVVNGVKSKLDMSGADSLTLAGTAYTQVPAYAGYTAADSCTYFVQGESVTFKAFQSAYLVPGEYLDITGVTGGYNPIPEDDYSKLAGLKSGVVSDMSTNHHINLHGNGYKAVNVKYVNDSTAKGYYYVYWDFQSVDDAVRYFNDMYATNEALLESKAEMLGTGSIKLPSDVHSKGNTIGYSDSKVFSHSDENWTATNASDCISAERNYENFTAGLSADYQVSDDVFENLFRNGSLGLVDSTTKVRKLAGPQSWTKGSAATNDLVTYSGDVVNAGGDVSTNPIDYFLVTGNDIALPGDISSEVAALGTAGTTNRKYVVIANGDVTVTGSFSGIIFAKGKVYIRTGLNMECFGNFKNKKSYLDEHGAPKTDVEYISEFDALLAVIGSDGDSDMEAGNTRLRNIFGIAGTGSGKDGDSGSANDIASVSTINYKKN